MLEFRWAAQEETVTQTLSSTRSFFSRSAGRGKAFGLALLCASALLVPATQAQNLQVLHAFTGGSDGAYPESALTLDRAGNLYGTTYGRTYGNVYELMQRNSNWIFKPLYDFQAENDGQNPEAPVVFGPDGTLYGTTPYGGNTCFEAYCGTAYNLRPSPRSCGNALCSWNEIAVYWFGGNQLHDGYRPETGPLIFDSAGNIYGTTADGGLNGDGTVFQLFRTQNGWGENIIDNLVGNGAPGHPQAGVTFDSAGNLYGTAEGGSYGVVYGLIRTGQGWNEETIYAFQGGNDGAYPAAGLIFDAAGNAYGTTAGGSGQPGTVFQLSPQGDGTWRETVLHVFTVDSIGPKANLAMDAAGNLYGSTQGLGGGDQFGMVFKLSLVNGSWTFSDVYHFTNGAEGAYPVGGVSVDSAGNLFGTCVNGGANNYGTVWEITR